jgi:hypothetical protein
MNGGGAAGLKLDVLRVRGGQVAETTTFGSSLFGAFGLPGCLPRTGNPAAGAGSFSPRVPGWQDHSPWPGRPRNRENSQAS